MSTGDAARRSGYARYLPAVLWDTEPATGFSINSLLLVAEKILSGIDDDAQLVHQPAGDAPHTHDGIETTLDRLHLMLDPGRAPPRFLPMLGAWLGVERFRSLNEFQYRRAIAAMVPALGRRGLHEGLRQLLSPFEAGPVQPRITLDDGARILFSTPAGSRAAPVHKLLSHGPFLRTRSVAAYPGLVDPGCLTATPDGHLLVGDDGLPGSNPAVGAGVWRVSRIGGYVDTEGAPPRPRPIGRTGRALDRPRAVVVERGAGPWRAYVLDRHGLYRIDSTDLDTRAILATRVQLGLETDAEAMVLDTRERLLVVSAGAVVQVNAGTAPATVTGRHPLQVPDLVPGPLVLHSGQLIVADIRSQDAADDADDAGPADLVLVNRSGAAGWTGRRLLATLPAAANPLVTPVALATEGPTSLLVLDVGLRPLTGDSGDPFYKTRAEPPAVYRVRLANIEDPARLTVTAIERVTEFGRLTRPNGLAVLDGTIYLTDPGQPVGSDDNPMIRNMPGHVAVQVHFSRQRPAGVTTRRMIAHDIATIVDRHCAASMLAARPHVPTESEEGALG